MIIGQVIWPMVGKYNMIDKNLDDGLVIEWFGGFCPVQAEGMIDGVPFYFRSRGNRWSISVGGEDVILDPAWYYTEEYGIWPDAGYISDEEAEEFMRKGAYLFREARRTEIIPNAVTLAAMNEPPETRKHFDTVEALMADLHADDEEETA